MFACCKTARRGGYVVFLHDTARLPDEAKLYGSALAVCTVEGRVAEIVPVSEFVGPMFETDLPFSNVHGTRWAGAPRGGWFVRPLPNESACVPVYSMVLNRRTVLLEGYTTLECVAAAPSIPGVISFTANV